MIKKVTLKNFKRFREQRFEIKDHVVLAGPNNSGKTTLLQAVACWHFALKKWLKERGKSGAKKRTGVAVTRRELLAMPVREMNLLWTDTSTALKRDEGKPGAPRTMCIAVEGEDKEKKQWNLTMEFRYSNSELIYAKPLGDSVPEEFSDLIVYIPSFSGISVEERVCTPDYQEWVIGQGKPGDVLRNLLVTVFDNSIEAWKKLNKEMEAIFHYRLLSPIHEGRPFIMCDYLPGIPPERGHGGLAKLDIASAGSGFLQTLMLMAFFYSRPGTVFLMDEPDAHLHVILQEQIYSRLRDMSRENSSQLIVATHSEVLINNTDTDKVVSFYGKPHILVEDTQRDAVREALKRLSAIDISLSENKRILYVEDESDFKILRVWARILQHATYDWFSGEKVFYRPMHGRKPKEAKDHFFALSALHPDMKGLILLDGDNKTENRREIENGLKTHTWERYEIENYLLNPDSIERFVKQRAGELFSHEAMKEMEEILPPVCFKDPLGKHDYLKLTSASKDILPPVLANTNVTKADYYLIAEQMKKEEIHEDVKSFFDLLQKSLQL